MPVETVQPQPISEQAKVLGDANYFKVLGFSYVESNPNSADTPSLTIQCYAGNKVLNEDGVTYHYETVRVWQVNVDEADLQVLASTVVSGTLYTTIRDALYAYLQGKGIFPVG